LTDSGRFTNKVVTWQSISLAQDRESSPARIDVLTTMLHHHRYRLYYSCVRNFIWNLQTVKNL